MFAVLEYITSNNSSWNTQYKQYLGFMPECNYYYYHNQRCQCLHACKTMPNEKGWLWTHLGSINVSADKYEAIKSNSMYTLSLLGANSWGTWNDDLIVHCWHYELVVTVLHYRLIKCEGINIYIWEILLEVISDVIIIHWSNMFITHAVVCKDNKVISVTFHLGFVYSGIVIICPIFRNSTITLSL